MNVLADLASYKIINDGIIGIRATSLARSYYEQIKTGGFSTEDIKEDLNNKAMRSEKLLIKT